MHLGLYYAMAVAEHSKGWEKRKDGGWAGLVVGKAGPGALVDSNWMPDFELAMRFDPLRAGHSRSRGSHSLFVGFLVEVSDKAPGTSDPWVHKSGTHLYKWVRVVPLPEACLLFCNNGFWTDGAILSDDEYVFAVRLLIGLPVADDPLIGLPVAAKHCSPPIHKSQTLLALVQDCLAFAWDRRRAGGGFEPCLSRQQAAAQPSPSWDRHRRTADAIKHLLVGGTGAETVCLACQEALDLLRAPQPGHFGLPVAPTP